MHINEDDLAFLEAIRQAPYDDAPRLVYADWLEERDDSRFEYIRKMYEIIGHIRAGTSYEHLAIPFRTLAEGYSQEWRNVVSKRFQVTLEAITDSTKKINVIRSLRHLVHVGLSEAKAISDTLPQMIQEGVSTEQALACQRILQTGDLSDPTIKRFPWPPSEWSRQAYATIQESGYLPNPQTPYELIASFTNQPTRRLWLLDRLVATLPNPEVLTFLLARSRDSSIPGSLRVRIWSRSSFSGITEPDQLEQMRQTAEAIATQPNLLEPRIQVLEWLMSQNTQQQYDPLFVGILQNRHEFTEVRDQVVRCLIERRPINQIREHEPVLLQILQDESESEPVRCAIFWELTETPRHDLHHVFRSLNGGEQLQNHIQRYFHEL